MLLVGGSLLLFELLLLYPFLFRAPHLHRFVVVFLIADEAPESSVVLAVVMGVALGATVGADLVGGWFRAVLC